MTRVTVAALLFWAGSVSAGAPSHNLNATAADGVWSCETSAGTTTYLSSVFRATATRDAMQNAFAQVLSQQYGFNGRVDCPMAYADQTSIDKLQSDQRSRIAQLRGAGQKVVETGWAFGATTSVPYFCYGTVTVTQAGHANTLFYMTDAFRVTGADRATLVAAWDQHLRGLHPGFGPNGYDCVTVPPTDDAAKALRQNAVAQHRVDDMQVIAEPWTYGGRAPQQDDRIAWGATAPPAADDTRLGYFCVARSTDHKTMYQSRVEVADGTFNESAASQAWTSHVVTAYGLNAGYAHSGCASGPISQEQVMRTQSRGADPGVKWIDVDWKFAPSHAPVPANGNSGAPTNAVTASPGALPAAPSATTSPHVAPSIATVSPPTPTSAAPNVPPPSPRAQTHGPNEAHPKSPVPKNPWVCQADAYTANKRTHYITDAFESDETQQQLVPVWRAHLVSAYQLPGQVVAHCGRLPKQSEDAIEAALAKNQNVPLVHDHWQP